MTKPSTMIKNVPVSERPREKMIKNGPECLSNQELLAVLLRTGSKHESVLQLSQRVLYDFDGLHLLKEATVEELQKIKGIGQAKALELRAALELGRRIYTYQEGEKYVIRSPEDVSSYVMEDMRFLTQEHFVILCLNTKNQVIHRQTLFIGSLNSSIVHPRELFKEALRRSAASVICLHNHPSGDPAPSNEDIEVTKRLIECGHLLGIEVLDHIIIGDRKFSSLKEKGYI
ncbi:JAB domain-containing protein [Salibacterium salarium]|uniref:JAB domain-containing protein n=1 Tax=Salibacterium salarium TaxID=284579 RepID=A0A428N210_9BACI|nr:DNA repair protein RadC [Salibacterium salarium]RSL32272.1 JAB domain-containing protein [Salibacterium salarium]